MMLKKFADNMPYYTFCELEKPEFNFVRFAVSTREGGVSEGDALGTLNMGSKTKDSKENVRENYRRFCDALKFSTKNVVLGNQTHSDNVRLVTVADAGKGVFSERDYTDVDALITNEKNLPLAIHTADCVPVTLIDIKNKAVGNAHCGWKGTFSCLASKTLQEMHNNFGTVPEDVTAIIGPCIHKCCYEVSEDLYIKFSEKFNDNSVIFTKDNKFFLDLPGINKKILENAGVKNILVSPLCTCCNKDIFYSHRGLGPERGIFATFIEIIN